MGKNGIVIMEDNPLEQWEENIFKNVFIFSSFFFVI